MSNTDKVFIRDLEINMSVGIYDQERENKQRVIINITMDVETNFKKEVSSIKNVVSYEDIVNSVIKMAKSKHYELLEEFAEKISDICLNNQKVKDVFVSVEKPDIIKECKSVGIEIRRTRNLT